MWRKENGWVLLMVDIHARLCIHNPKPWNWRFHAARWLLSSVWDGGSLTQKVLSQLLFALARFWALFREHKSQRSLFHTLQIITPVFPGWKKKKLLHVYHVGHKIFLCFGMLSRLHCFPLLSTTAKYVRKLIKFWLT